MALANICLVFKEGKLATASGCAGPLGGDPVNMEIHRLTPSKELFYWLINKLLLTVND